MAQRSAALPAEAWREITIAMGRQGPRTYRYSAQRVRVTRQRKPGEVLWAVYRQNMDGSEPRYYLSNAPEDTPAPEDTSLEPLAHVGGSRWRIETEFETEKSDVGLDEYEDPHLGRLASSHCHVPAGGCLPADPAAGLGGKRCPGSRGPRCTEWCVSCCRGNGSGRRAVAAVAGRTSNCATNEPDAPMRNAAPPVAPPPVSLPKLSL